MQESQLGDFIVAWLINRAGQTPAHSKDDNIWRNCVIYVIR